MSFDLEAEMFKSAQMPFAWLLSAERLRDAAEVILLQEQAKEVPYFQAYADAQQEALVDALSPGNSSGIAEIKAVPPNYPPAQLFYAYAIENVLKGLIIANTPTLAGEVRLDGQLKSHDLIELSRIANFTVHVHEELILKRLSQVSVWAGRYPVALSKHQYANADSKNPDELLDYGSAHPHMSRFFERAREQLESRLPHPIESRFCRLVVTRPPGT